MRLIVIIISLALSASTSHAISWKSICQRISRWTSPPSAQNVGGERIDSSNADEYIVDDTAHVDFSVFGAVLHRVLEFDICTVLPDGTRSRSLSAAREFEQMLRFFEGRFDVIEGGWGIIESAPSRNLNEFNDLIRPPHNLSLEQAALHTWTGRQCVRMGYSQVRIMERVMGEEGRYQTIRAHFSRP